MPLLLHIPLCKRIIAQAVLVSLRQKQVVTTSKCSCSSPCKNAQKNRSCKCPSSRSSIYEEITWPSCTWRSGSAVQGVRGCSQHASCRWCVVLELRFHPLDVRGGRHTLGTCSRSCVGRDQFVGDRGLGTETLFIRH